MSEPRRVLLIEDQHDIAANIWDFLERRGYALDHAADGEAGLAAAVRGGFDVIVLDLGLPRLDGLLLCRRLRATGHATPVIMLTARDTLDDKLRGFAEGADDYLVKPFALSELEARIRAVFRRGRVRETALAAGRLRYRPGSRSVICGGRSIMLTRTQSILLEVLMRRAPHIVPHAELVAAVWGEEGGDSAALHTHVYELRKLIAAAPTQDLIRSVHGLGYRLEVD
ncbi:MAG: response regulator transcription factor [Rhodanobacteraceae bacterium]|nr:response regulator transcription factor [Rhodanobacteraceae bacterium]